MGSLLDICKIANKIICDFGKITKSKPNKSSHFAPAYLGGSNKLRASLEFLYDFNTQQQKIRQLSFEESCVVV